MEEKTYIIGIDLGTTNCTLAYYDQRNSNNEIVQFMIPQITAQGTVAENPSLPSFLYFPTEEERSSLDSTQSHVAGIYARNRGKEVPSRLIASAKSWLCYSGIDRREPILPLGTDEELVKLSPLDACAALLQHLREAWDKKMDHPLAAQQILITIPASFDPGARQLVIEAAEKAGYPEVILLEEPQAAFYAWLQTHEKEWRKLLTVDDKILVVDIGGGTTDFSLIQVKNETGDLSLHRLAVGSHLLLGGDNIDFGLAYLAKQKMEEAGHLIDEWQFQALVHSCREAKEQLFSQQPKEHVDITIMGRGSRLIGGSLKTTLTLEEAKSMILEGFFPLGSAEDRSKKEKRSGIQELGLPYVQDARISCQLSKFLSMTGESDESSMENFVYPAAVLFNGGTMKASAFRERILSLLNSWSETAGKPLVKELSNADYDFAVSRGAVYYGRARQGKAIRIKSGTSRSYFIGIEESIPAVPGLEIPLKGICVAPFGMEEGTELQLQDQEFALVVGELSTFRFFSHLTPTLSNGTSPQMGTIIKNWKKELTELHPLEARLSKEEEDGKTIRVKIRSRFTELGMLEVWCVAADERKWKLEFDIRKEEVLLT